MKSVLISIRPQWCEKIANGTKTVEVRKTRPKLETPFKCYIYCTKDGKNPLAYSDYCGYDMTDFSKDFLANGQVIGEFVCDRISKIFAPFGDKTEGTCLTAKELYEYVEREFCYGWHISKLEIYDKPKSLSEFRTPCREYEKDCPQCGSCDFYHSMGEYPAECGCDGKKPVIRPPQSWCYVEGGEGNGRT